jgi:uncharacterized repeat protein (TIGR03803 family)
LDFAPVFTTHVPLLSFYRKTELALKNITDPGGCMSETYSLSQHIGPRWTLLAAVLGLLVTATQPAWPQTETVLYSFAGGTDGANPYFAFAGGSDGANPWAGLVRDKQGNLYGTTMYGGNSNCSGGCGVVFKVTP